MRKLSLLLVFMFLALGLTWAGGGKEKGSAKNDTVVLTYYDWQLTEEPAGSIVRQQLDLYQTLHPNVRIELQPVPTAQRGDKLMTMIIGGATPDIIHVNEADLSRFVPMNSFEPLNAYLDTDPELRDALIPALVDMTTFHNNVYAIPRFASINTLIYNAAHFRQAGLDPDKPPKTWDEFVEYGKKLTRDTNGDKKTDRWGVGLLGAKTSSLNFRYWWALWGAGGEILNADETKSLLGSPESIAAIKFYTDLANVYGIVPPGVTDEDYTALVNDFINEKTSMICDGPWQISRIMEENPNIELRAAPMPVRNSSYTSAAAGGGGFLGISATGKNKEIAWDVVRFLSSAENHWEYVSKGSFLPGRTDTVEKLFKEGNPLMGEFAATLKYSKLAPRIPQMTQINMLLAEEIQYVFINQKTPEEAAKSLSSRVDALLKK